MGMEIWSTSISFALREIGEKSPTSSPVSLGSMGYVGTSGQYVLSEVLDAALEAPESLPLDWYRSYNASRHKPHLYFDPVEKIDKSKLKFCNATSLADPIKIEQYAEITGDLEGVEWVDGKLQGKCYNEHFWLPPMCRETTANCFLFITVLGYEVDVMMQRATAYDMPVVPADLKDWAAYVQIPTEVGSAPVFFNIWWFLKS